MQQNLLQKGQYIITEKNSLTENLRKKMQGEKEREGKTSNLKPQYMVC